MTQYIPAAPGDATHGFTITPGATVFSPPLSSIWVPSTGNITLLMMGDTVAVTLTAAPVGMITGILVQQITAFSGSTGSLIGFS